MLSKNHLGMHEQTKHLTNTHSIKHTSSACLGFSKVLMLLWYRNKCMLLFMGYFDLSHIQCRSSNWQTGHTHTNLMRCNSNLWEQLQETVLDMRLLRSASITQMPFQYSVMETACLQTSPDLCPPLMLIWDDPQAFLRQLRDVSRSWVSLEGLLHWARSQIPP